MSARGAAGKKNAAEPSRGAGPGKTAAEWTGAYEQLRRAVLTGADGDGLSVIQRQGMAAWMRAGGPAMPDSPMRPKARIDAMRVSFVAQLLASVALGRLWEE